jgi:hypothetical protein
LLRKAQTPSAHPGVTLGVANESAWADTVTTIEDAWGHIGVLTGNAACLHVGTTGSSDLVG